MKTQYYIGWWNVENLFDVFDSPSRPEWLQRALNSELKGWTQAVLQRKIFNLVKIISQMNNGRGPDILGVCEVENLPVLQQLVEALHTIGRDYAVAHHDSSDQRGIDVAFIYDKTLFEAKEQFSYTVLKRSSTRDLFQVTFVTPKQNELILIGNHWPARSAGVYESEPYRIIAAETLSYWMQRITEIKGKDIAVACMGDFNDEPLSRSVTDYALSTNSVTKVQYAISPRLFNLMWPCHGDGTGTFYYNNFPYVFDQFMVSKELVQTSGKPRVVKDLNGKLMAGIGYFPEMITGGRYPTPKKFGRPAEKSSYDPYGFSDHFPVWMVVEE